MLTIAFSAKFSISKNSFTIRKQKQKQKLASEQLTTTPIIAPEATVQTNQEQPTEQPEHQQSQPQPEQKEPQQEIVLEADKDQSLSDIKVIHNGRDILDICSNINNSWNIRYTYLPENNFQMYLANRSQYHRLSATWNTREYSLDICRRCYFQYPVKYQENAEVDLDDVMPLVTIYPDNHYLGLKFANATYMSRSNAIAHNSQSLVTPPPPPPPPAPLPLSSSDRSLNHGIPLYGSMYGNNNPASLKSQTPTNFFNNNNSHGGNNGSNNASNGVYGNGLTNSAFGGMTNFGGMIGNNVGGMGNTSMNNNQPRMITNNMNGIGSSTLSYSGMGSSNMANGGVMNGHSSNMLNGSGNGGAIPKQYPNMNRPNYNNQNNNINHGNKMPYKMYSHF